FAERLFLRACRGSSFLEDFPFESNTFALAAFQRGDYLCLFLLHVFLWIDSPADGAPALLRHRVEVGAPAALSSKHQDGMPCLIRPDVIACSFLLHLLLQFL